MGSFSIWHWLIVLIYVGLVAWPLWRIVGKTGNHPALSLLLHIPVVNVALILFLAFSEWPVRKY